MNIKEIAASIAKEIKEAPKELEKVWKLLKISNPVKKPLAA
jgi:hypothetical protein